MKIPFKYKKDAKLFSALHPIVLMIFTDMWNYAYEKHGVHLTVTQTKSNKFIDQKLKRKSPAHSEGRAIDIRTKDVDSFVLADVLQYINNKKEYKKYHYRSLSGHNRLAYWHKGTAEHIHLCIHAKFANKDI